jgi:hypothetical protein
VGPGRGSDDPRASRRSRRLGGVQAVLAGAARRWTRRRWPEDGDRSDRDACEQVRVEICPAVVAKKGPGAVRYCDALVGAVERAGPSDGSGVRTSSEPTRLAGAEPCQPRGRHAPAIRRRGPSPPHEELGQVWTAPRRGRDESPPRSKWVASGLEHGGAATGAAHQASWASPRVGAMAMFSAAKLAG